MKDLETLNLLETLPDAIAKDVSMQGLAYAFQRQYRKLAKHIDSGALFTSIDKLSSTQLDHLAQQFDLSTWRDQWPVSLKRSVLKAVFATKRRIGTVSAVREVLASIGSAAEIVEWWQTEPKGNPHTFNIVTTLSNINGTLSAEMQEDLQNMIKDTKPARSHFTFTLNIAHEGGIGFCGYVRPMVVSRISNI